MHKYLDPEGVSYLWSKIKNISKKNLVYYSNSTYDWNKNPLLISEKNVLYIYTDYKRIRDGNDEILIPGLKVGDGSTYLIDLPFLNSAAIEQDFMDHINDKVIHVSLYDREFWNNKLNLELELQEENLILNRE